MRIQIIGGPGAGKTTLASMLAGFFDLPLIEGDKYLWADSDYTVRRPEKKITRMLEDALKEAPHYVFDGQPDEYAPQIKLDTEVLLFIKVPEDVRMERLESREKQRFGKRIEEGGDLYEESRDFIEWASAYAQPTDKVGTYLSYHEKMFFAFQGKKMILDGTKSIVDLINDVLALLDE